MSAGNAERDPLLGCEPRQGYKLTEKVGTGGIGSVYKAERLAPVQHVLACKVIRPDRLKQGWQRELEKAILLAGVPHVVQYVEHGSALDQDQKPFIWVLWTFVKGRTLRDYVVAAKERLDVEFVCTLLKTVLGVLHACSVLGIHHGDLHQGNILIADPDPRIPGNPETIWISDFGYGGSHNRVQPKDDYRQLYAICKRLLSQLDTSGMTARDRLMTRKLGELLDREVLEADPTQGPFVHNAARILDDLLAAERNAERESAEAIAAPTQRKPDEYLWAEALGNNPEEWRSLFVPQFLAAAELLKRNTTILTGARGCGKTMAFRRLTLFMDRVIGQGSGVEGADTFIGFYLNCRDLVEAFPWIPNRIVRGMRDQLVHYFHLAWFSEVFRALALATLDGTVPNGASSRHFEWANVLLAGFFRERYRLHPVPGDVLAHARAFLEDEKERCFRARFGAEEGLEAWPLGRTDVLEKLELSLREGVPEIGNRPLYFFLDDYTMPLVPAAVQEVLNEVIFARRSGLFFKVASESAISFSTAGVRGKDLELHHDFELIDLASESLRSGRDAKRLFLNDVFRPRIRWHELFANQDYSLDEVLGSRGASDNELARKLRARKQFNYFGWETFVGMWSSDTRTLIKVFADMIRKGGKELAKEAAQGFPSVTAGAPLVPASLQHATCLEAGADFLRFIEAAEEPVVSGVSPSDSHAAPGGSANGQEPYGTRLKRIVNAFVQICSHELTEGPLLPGNGTGRPKQAFRLEVIDELQLSEEATRLLAGLIKYHVFLQDWRGKSVRGLMTPRLYLNGVLIPFSRLTFSRKDNISLTSEELTRLLLTPSGFVEEYVKGRREKIPPGPDLWGKTRG
jgi:hypothetical protein